MRDFWLCFVPLFVAVDAVGVLPLFMGITEGVEPRASRRIVLQSVATAAAVAVLFIVGGRLLLGFLGVTVGDFLIAGGTLLFALSLQDILTAGKKRRRFPPDSLGAVPLGVPLIVGPAVLTTTLVLVDQYGLVMTAGATIVNIVIAGVVFSLASPINRLIGRAGAQAVSKIASLLLAAIGVLMVRRGIVLIVGLATSAS